MTDSQEEAPKERAALELAPAVRQVQVLAPQLRASLRVLQMDLPTLSREIRHEAETNPVVEVDSPLDMPTVSEEMRSEENQEVNSSEGEVEDESNPSVNIDEAAAERRQRFFDRQVAVESLQEHLLAQIGPAGFTEEERQFAELIIGDIDDDGRYVGSLEELSLITGKTDLQFDAILKRIQAFDPPGVGARNLRECLEIQTLQQNIPPAVKQLVLRIVHHHLSAVARRDILALSHALDVSESDCRVAVRILRTLEPKPGRPFLANGRHPQFIRPEIEVEWTRAGIVLTSCEHELPSLTISPMYREMAEDEATPYETRRYLKDRIGSAELLCDAIRRRGETVLRVGEAVFKEQYEFLEKGFEAIRPLTIEEVARQTGLHGTTVGRAVRGKYVRTPRGVFELTRFFCVGRLAREGESLVSATAVKCRLSALIQAEEDTILRDEDLAQELCKSGLKISRRTIAKYRSELGIPAAAERKRRRVV